MGEGESESKWQVLRVILVRLMELEGLEKIIGAVSKNGLHVCMCKICTSLADCTLHNSKWHNSFFSSSDTQMLKNGDHNNGTQARGVQATSIYTTD